MRLVTLSILFFVIVAIIFLWILYELPDGKMPGESLPEAPRIIYILSLIGHCVSLLIAALLWILKTIGTYGKNYRSIVESLIVILIIVLWISVIISNVVRTLNRIHIIEI